MKITVQMRDRMYRVPCAWQPTRHIDTPYAASWSRKYVIQRLPQEYRTAVERLPMSVQALDQCDTPQLACALLCRLLELLLARWIRFKREYSGPDVFGGTIARHLIRTGDPTHVLRTIPQVGTLCERWPEA